MIKPIIIRKIFMDRLNRLLFLLINFITAFLFTSITLLNIKSVINSQSGIFIIISEMFLVAVLFLITYYMACCPNIKRPEFIFYLILSTSVLRILWILAVPTRPANDFLAYQSYANNISIGFPTAYDPSYAVFPFKIGYPFVLSVIYKISGTNLFLAKAFNVLLAAIAGVQIYFIAVHLFGERAGRISAALFVIWPSQIMYTSVLASEHLFIVLFLLTVQVFLKGLKSKAFVKKSAIAVWVGILLTATQFIRPISLLLFPIFFLYILFFIRLDGRLSYSIIKKISLICIILISYVGSLYLLNSAIYNRTQINIMRSSSGYNLLVGSNFKYNGMANDEDAGILKEFNYDFEKIHSAAKARAFERIKSSPHDFINLIIKKIHIQWTGESYGYYWSTDSLSYESTVTNAIKSNSTYFYDMSNIYYLFIVLLSIVNCLYMFQKSNYPVIILNCIFLCLFASYIFFEVQSRYHFPAVPIFIVLSGAGMELVLTNFVSDEWPNKTIPVFKGLPARIIAVSVLAAAIVLLTGVKKSGFSTPQLTETGLISYRILYNQNRIDFKTEPVLVKNILHVPLQEFTNAIGAETYVDNIIGEVKIRFGDNYILFYQNSRRAVQNGKEILLNDPVPVSKSGVLIPLRPVSEAFGIKVSFDPTTNNIILQK